MDNALECGLEGRIGLRSAIVSQIADRFERGNRTLQKQKRASESVHTHVYGAPDVSLAAVIFCVC